jgi:2-amino-4-hydroxy-6-hydroxymethyldihydropteridine diphosphokinase
MPLHRVYIGVGSNLGDRTGNLDGAVERLGRVEGVRVAQRSSNYLTRPVGPEEQPDYFNCAVEIETSLAPEELLAALKGIEKEMGREPGPRWGARVIDLDILLYDREIVEREDLKIPHPEMHRRVFVLEPLSEIAPDAVHPVLGATVKKLMQELNKEREGA